MKPVPLFVFITLLSSCTDSQDKPISSDQHRILLRTLSNHSELQGMYDAAKADGMITKREYLNILYQVSVVSGGSSK